MSNFFHHFYICMEDYYLKKKDSLVKESCIVDDSFRLFFFLFQHGPEWLINEDWALLQVRKNFYFIYQLS